VDSQLGFQLVDAPARREQLSALRRRQAGLKSVVDPVLVAPAVDGLVTDPKVPGDVLDAASRRHKIKKESQLKLGVRDSGELLGISPQYAHKLRHRKDVSRSAKVRKAALPVYLGRHCV
jgi:hypothetical protein